ncbi:MAG: VacJ family lipoprotein [Lactobacillus sp.]|nr:VacJ family lipoprotein [Lactobacillus sp.]
MTKKLPLFFILGLLFAFDVKAVEVTTSDGEKITIDENADYDVHVSNDPWESFNRPMFVFNHTLDVYILKPVAKGYRVVTTQGIRNRVISVLSNLKEPLATVNHLLQGEPVNSVTSLGRFVVNSTLGLAGMFDVAGGWGWRVDKTTFDHTLGKYCVPDGPYLVLPFMGSTTPRALVAKVADGALDPVYLATLDRDDGWIPYGAYAMIGAVAFRESVIELSDDLERNSVDLYTTYRSVYLQNKAKYNCINEDNITDLYDFDFDE